MLERPIECMFGRIRIDFNNRRLAGICLLLTVPYVTDIESFVEMNPPGGNRDPVTDCLHETRHKASTEGRSLLKETILDKYGWIDWIDTFSDYNLKVINGYYPSKESQPKVWEEWLSGFTTFLNRYSKLTPSESPEEVINRFLRAGREIGERLIELRNADTTLAGCATFVCTDLLFVPFYLYYVHRLRPLLKEHNIDTSYIVDIGRYYVDSILSGDASLSRRYIDDLLRHLESESKVIRLMSLYTVYKTYTSFPFPQKKLRKMIIRLASSDPEPVVAAYARALLLRITEER